MNKKKKITKTVTIFTGVFLIALLVFAVLINQNVIRLVKPETTLSSTPAVESNYRIQEIESLEPEVNELLQKTHNTALSKTEMITLLNEMYIKDQSENRIIYEPEIQNRKMYFRFDFDTQGNLIRTLYQDQRNKLNKSDIYKQFGYPEYVYEKSPSDESLTELVYAYKGFSVFLSGELVDAIMLYSPVTLDEYQNNYTDMIPVQLML